MKANDICSKKTEKLLATGALIISSVAVVVLFATAILPAQTRQGEVAARGAKVMPFDLKQTTHVFQKLDDGGLQKVIVKDPANKKQIALIQSNIYERLGIFPILVCAKCSSCPSQACEAGCLSSSVLKEN